MAKASTSATAGTSNYSTSEIAKNAAKTLSDATGFDINNLADYSTDGTLRNDYRQFYDYADILGRLNNASDAAYDLSRQEQINALNRAEDANYANIRNAISEMRKSLIGSGSSGANVGAANATALQGLLGLGQQNVGMTTEGMQSYQNTAKEAASARAQNAVTAFDNALNGMNSMYSNATSAYGSDKNALGYRAQGAGEGLGNVASTVDSAASQERMNNATNETNASIANTNQVSTVYNRTKKG